jgi:L-lactate dehydrogenase complex protein LldG
MSLSARNKILSKIRLALTHSTPIPFPDCIDIKSPFQPLQQDIVVEFAEQFTALQGKFIFCSDFDECKIKLKGLFTQSEWKRIYSSEEKWKASVPPPLWTDDIINCDAAITSCEVLVARIGSIVLSSKNSGRITSVYAPIHICIAYASQIVYDIEDAFIFLKQKYNDDLPSFITLATGPSRTADIEKTLVVGVHGPKEVYLFLIDD